MICRIRLTSAAIGLALTLGLVPEPIVVAIASNSRAAATSDSTFMPRVTGNIAGYRLAGLEPDGDPLYQTALSMRLAPSGKIPSMHLVVNSYLENFKPDTTPILPDLLHPNQKARAMGGFLTGRALLTDDAGNVLFIGSFLAEAFLDNSNHAVMTLDGSGSARGGRVRLKGTFTLRHSGAVAGQFQGSARVPASALVQIARHRGQAMRPVERILKLVTVKPAYMMGRVSTHSASPLRTGFNAGTVHQNAGPRSISPWTIAAGIGAAISFLLAGLLYWMSRKNDLNGNKT